MWNSIYGHLDALMLSHAIVYFADVVLNPFCQVVVLIVDFREKKMGLIDVRRSREEHPVRSGN